MPKKKILKTQLSLIEWCDQQVKEGKELKIKWEGGGDSGWTYFQIDGEEVTNEYTEALVNLMYNQLDYGSWAGEFSANGEAVYNPENKCFEGDDHYSEDTSIAWELGAIIRIPKSIWFDTVVIEVDGYDNASSHIDITVRNGFVTEEHTNLQKQLEEYLDSMLEQATESFSKSHDLRSVWMSMAINGSDFKEDGEDLIFQIENVDLGSYESTDKEIILELEETTMPNEKN